MRSIKYNHRTLTRFFTVVCLYLLIAGCGSDDPEEALILPISPSDIVASNPDWRVEVYNNNGQNNTSDFNNYTFEIFSNGDFLINLNGLNDSFGGWSISSDELVLTISLSNPKPATDGIAGSWHVTAKSATTLTLEAADGSNTSFRLSK